MFAAVLQWRQCSVRKVSAAYLYCWASMNICGCPADFHLPGPPSYHIIYIRILGEEDELFRFFNSELVS